MDEHTANTPERDEDVFRQIRSDIRAGNLSWAEELLDGVADRGAEWHFLKGAVCFRKGWMDEARQHYEAACKMEPENEEYRKAAVWMREGKRYSPRGTLEGTLSTAVPALVVCGSILAGGFCARQCCVCGGKSCMNGCACCLTCGYMDGVSPPYDGYCFS